MCVRWVTEVIHDEELLSSESWEDFFRILRPHIFFGSRNLKKMWTGGAMFCT